MLFGHSESISFLMLNSERNTIVSSDSLGKIKICNFPNIFDLRTVLMYDNYRYLSFFGKNFLLVVNYDDKVKYIEFYS